MNVRLIDLVVIVAAAMLLGAALALLAWSTTLDEGSGLWGRLLSVGTALALTSAMVGSVGTIHLLRSRRAR